MNVRIVLVGAVAAVALVAAGSAQAGPPADAHERHALLQSFEDAHDRAVPVTDRTAFVAGSGGFDWGDAVIGAIGGVGIAVLIAGVAFLTLAQRGTRPVLR